MMLNMDINCAVIPAKAGIQQKNKFRIADKTLVLSRYAGRLQSLDSGLRRNDEVLA